MKIELKNVSYNARLSQETNAFAADVWIDGKKAGDVRNAGHGGPNEWNPSSLQDKIDIYAATLPELDVSDLYGDGKKHTMAQDAELLIGELINEWVITRDVKRLMTKRILYTKKGRPGIYQTKVLVPSRKEQLLAQPDKMAEAWNTDKILNLLPEAEVVALYRAAE